MPESLSHSALVRRLVAYVRVALSKNSHLAILDDLSGELGCEKPPCLDGFRPDLFATDILKTTTVIGEAKTRQDIETEHSRDQYLAYARYLRLCESPILILAVPWQLRVRAKALMRCAAEQVDAQKIHCIVIDDVQELPS